MKIKKNVLLYCFICSLLAITQAFGDDYKYSDLKGTQSKSSGKNNQDKQELVRDFTSKQQESVCYAAYLQKYDAVIKEMGWDQQSKETELEQAFKDGINLDEYVARIKEEQEKLDRENDAENEDECKINCHHSISHEEWQKYQNYN